MQTLQLEMPTIARRQEAAVWGGMSGAGVTGGHCLASVGTHTSGLQSRVIRVAWAINLDN